MFPVPLAASWLCVFACTAADATRTCLGCSSPAPASAAPAPSRYVPRFTFYSPNQNSKFKIQKFLMLLTEVVTSAPSPTQALVAALTAIAGAVAAVLAKRRYSRTRPIENRKSKIENDLITRAEFHQSQDAMRDRQTATVMAIGEKMDQNQKELVATITHQGLLIEQRLDKLDTTVARLHERTK